MGQRFHQTFCTHHHHPPASSKKNCEEDQSQPGVLFREPFLEFFTSIALVLNPIKALLKQNASDTLTEGDVSRITVHIKRVRSLSRSSVLVGSCVTSGHDHPKAVHHFSLICERRRNLEVATSY
jgi:hypothetical protein